LSSQFAARSDRRFQFQNRGQLFIGSPNEFLGYCAPGEDAAAENA
jgi:hypothetical protein